MKINDALIFTFFVLISTVISSHDLLGVAPQDEKYYKGLWSSGAIKCKDGSRTFTKSQLNDDFCDCFDGTDEPGTSACPNGKFYCRNAGHSALTIFSSRINDGICDCCDGSDEYDGKTRCNNTCWEAGKVARDKLMEKIALFREGVSIRKHEIEQAKISAAKDEAELSKLKNEEKILKGIVQQLKEHKERIEKAVEKERIQKEKEEKQKKEAEEAESKEHKGEKHGVDEQEPVKNNDNGAAILDDSHSSQESPAELAVDVVQNAQAPLDNEEKHDPKDEGSEVVHESEPNTGLGSKGEDATTEIDSLSREDLGREVGARWTGKKTDQPNHDVKDAKNNYETSGNVHDEEYNGYDTETDEDHQHYDGDDTEAHMDDVGPEANDDSSSYNYDPDDDMDILDVEIESNPSWFEKIQRTVRNILQTVNPFQKPVDISEAENVRKEYDEASTKLSKLRSRISRLTKKLGNDFGSDKEFYLLYGQCFESKQNKYVYKVCPFKQATQEEGYSTTRLGKWEKFEESYNVMLFSNGDNCWNGPDRSLKVILRCGLKVELADVDEPSRCEYSAMLTTPALCLEGKLKELEDELAKQAQPHDEL